MGNPREFLEAEKEDQEIAEACKRLIKNCIICWNYLYLSQKLEEIKDAARREALLDGVAHGSAVAWRHLNLLGEYDFSEEKLRDSVGIRLPKLKGRKNWELPNHLMFLNQRELQKTLWNFTYLCANLTTSTGCHQLRLSERNIFVRQLQISAIWVFS